MPGPRAPAVRSVIGALATAALLAAGGGVSAQAPDTGWVRLFNGRDLDGWTVKITGRAVGEDPARTFRVADGVLKVAYEGYGEFGGAFGHLFYRTPFTEYVLRVEYRFTGEQAPGGPAWALRNSGVMLHAQAPETMARDQEFPVSIEVQFLGGTGTGDRPTGNLCTPGTNVVMDGGLVTRHCTNSRSATFHGDRWVVAEVVVRASGIRHVIDGDTVLGYEAPQLDPQDPDAQRLIRGPDLLLRGGFIALQSESHPVEFRRVELRPLGAAR